jgi:NitT/TauT family transport system substrate-binding protein
MGASSALGLRSGPVTAEPPPETTSIRLISDPEVPVLCYASQYVAEQFLRLEGFTDIKYVPYGPAGTSTKTLETVVHSRADICAALGAVWIAAIDQNAPVSILCGLHAGCFEVFGNDRVASVRDLKGKRVAITALGSDDHAFIASTIAYIGLSPKTDIEWVIANPKDWSRLLADKKVDVIGTFPPMSYDIHASGVGHVIINTTTDEPWRNYFCCMIGGHRDYIERNPVATKRAIRAIIKANMLCSTEPASTAKWLVERGFAQRYDYALKTLQDVLYDAWRSYDPEDTVLFYALRMREAGLISSTPEQIVKRGTDWHFLNEVKRALKT